MIRIFIPLTLLALLAGCGHKGPLYLPQAKTPAKAVKGHQDRPAPESSRTSAPAAD